MATLTDNNDGTASIDLDAAGVFADADGTISSYSASSSDTNVATVSITSNVLTVSALGDGTATITVTATDDDGATVDDFFDVTVATTSTYSFDPADYSVGQTPTEWTARENLTSFDIADDSGELYMDVVGVDNARSLLEFTEAGSQTDVEIYAELGIDNTEEGHVIARASSLGDASLLTAYTANRNLNNFEAAGGDDQEKLVIYDGGSPSAPVTPISTSNYNIHSFLFEVTGTTVRAKFWERGTSEPGTWDFEITDSTITSAGATGLLLFYASLRCYFFGVGVNGTSAPRA